MNLLILPYSLLASGTNTKIKTKPKNPSESTPTFRAFALNVEKWHLSLGSHQRYEAELPQLSRSSTILSPVQPEMGLVRSFQSFSPMV